VWGGAEIYQEDINHPNKPKHERQAHRRNARALKGFLREHYTTKAEWAVVLASYLTRPRAANSTVRPAENSFLKIVWATWRKVSTTSWWLIGQLAKLLRV
jgi:hypothetical protein